MAPHSSVLAWRIPGMGEPGGLPSLGSQSRTRLKRLSSSSSSSRHTCEWRQGGRNEHISPGGWWEPGSCLTLPLPLFVWKNPTSGRMVLWSVRPPSSCVLAVWMKLLILALTTRFSTYRPIVWGAAWAAPKFVRVRDLLLTASQPVLGSFRWRP